MPAPRFLVVTVAVLFAGLLAACGSSGPSADDLKPVIQAQMDANPIKTGVQAGRTCVDEHTNIINAYDGIEGVTVTKSRPVPADHLLPYGYMCVTFDWHGPDVADTELKFKKIVTVGKYTLDTVGAPVAGQDGTYTVPIIAHFVYTPPGKGLAANHQGNAANVSPTMNDSVIVAKDANGKWQLRKP